MHTDFYFGYFVSSHNVSRREHPDFERKHVLCFRLGNWSEKGLLDSDVREESSNREQRQRWPIERYHGESTITANHGQDHTRRRSR